VTSFVVHDLKNSISTLEMLSLNAMDNFDDPEFQRDAIKTISRSVSNMKLLLARLSSAPRAEHLQRSAIDVRTVVQGTLDAMRPRRGVSLVSDLQPLSPVPADAEALSRVVHNLVTNAVEAIDGEGVVTVKTYEEPGAAVLAVSDTGCGMSEEFIETSLFTPFRSTKRGGWGVGLHHVKTIVEGHQGTIDIDSKAGKGTTFTVRLPR